MNLILLPALDVAGFRGVWGGGVLSVVEPKAGRTVMLGRLKLTVGSRQLYEVEVVDDVDIVAAVVGARSRNKPTDLEIWHQQFGHGDVRVIKSMNDKGLVDGLEITNRLLNGMCEDCIFGKIVCCPFDEDVIPEGEPLDRVSVNLWGKARTVS